MRDAIDADEKLESPAGRGGAAVLFAAALALAAGADDSAWVYDTSQRVEPAVSRVVSATGRLDGFRSSSGAGADSTVDRKCRDSAASPETGLTSLPTGIFIIVR